MELEQKINNLISDLDGDEDALLIELLNQKIKNHYTEICQDDFKPFLSNRHIATAKNAAKKVAYNTLLELELEDKENKCFDEEGYFKWDEEQKLRGRALKIINRDEYREILKCKALIIKIKRNLYKTKI